jgi:hypothetical protein
MRRAGSSRSYGSRSSRDSLASGANAIGSRHDRRRGTTRAGDHVSDLERKAAEDRNTSARQRQQLRRQRLDRSEQPPKQPLASFARRHCGSCARPGRCGLPWRCRTPFGPPQSRVLRPGAIARPPSIAISLRALASLQLDAFVA